MFRRRFVKKFFVIDRFVDLYLELVFFWVMFSVSVVDLMSKLLNLGKFFIEFIDN